MDLYAPTSPSTSAIAARSTGLRALPVATGEGGGVIGLKTGEGGIEHFSARHEDDVESGWRLLSPEQLAGKTFRPVSDNCGAELSGCRNTESTPVTAVGRHKQSHEPAPQPHAVFIRPLKLGTPPDPLVSRKALRHRALLVLSLVRDSQTFSALRATSLQHDAAVLCCHSHAEAVSLAAATRVGLKRALPLCHCDSVLHTNWASNRRPVKLPILAVAYRMCQNRKPISGGVLQFAGVRGRRSVCAVTAVHSVSPPRFPHLWKTLWKSR